MATPAIKVEGLGKRYRLVHGQERNRYRTLRDTLVDAVKAPFRKRGTAEEFWALNDVSFEVRPGEVVGIIGRNGAGKSTLLKILSRITKPTTGRVEINGRVGSLLEVGTGFHPELTGRENVYLNGAILGMTRAEIGKKFDEIVAFAEVAKFLDTPVKRYSSGMYVRLAFAVAAHLEPEILIVDEVLAVGDSGFQQKCFNKMAEIKNSGRTVLVVSHNLGAILNICSEAINLESGRLLNRGLASEQVTWYLNRLASKSKTGLAGRTDREGDQRARVVELRLQDGRGATVTQAICGEELNVCVGWETVKPGATVDYVALSCWTSDGLKLFGVDNVMSGHAVALGVSQFACRIPRLPLIPGTYHLNVLIRGDGVIRDHVYSASTFEVLAGDFYRLGRTSDFQGGLIALDHDWRVPI
jgi:lipopolysaccharide transport system ATP-binding protein